MTIPTPTDSPLTTILLDLDNTLLGNDAHRFVMTYLARLAEALAVFGAAEELTTLALQAAQAMQANRDPDLTNSQVFYQVFRPALEGEEDALQTAFDHFYNTLYPSLESLVTPQPEAPTLVETLFARGYKVIIATNPMFERPAIEQRLAWAGVANYPYHLITTMEIMHFCKPHPEYYQEILDQVGSTPAESLMVGDDPENDIIPAADIGLRTWYIAPRSDPSHPVATFQGALSDFHRWIRNRTGRLRHPSPDHHPPAPHPPGRADPEDDSRPAGRSAGQRPDLTLPSGDLPIDG